MSAAVWLKGVEDGRWHLYVVTERVNGGKRLDAYGEVVRAAQELPELDFDMFQVRLRGRDEAIARDVEEHLSMWGTRPFRRGHLGNISVVDSHFYPTSTFASV